MNQNTIQSTMDILETFIQLRQQFLIILGWIAIKKNNKVKSRLNNFEQKQHINSYNVKSINRQNLSSRSRFWATKRRQPYNDYQILNEGYANINYYENKRQNFKTNYALNSYVFKDLEAQKRLKSRSDLKEKSVESDLLDSNEFSDVVISRLSQLEQSINQMLSEQYTQGSLRGYDGTRQQDHQHQYNFQEDKGFKNNKQHENKNDRSPQMVIEDKLHENCLQLQISSNKKGKNVTFFNSKYIPITEKLQKMTSPKVKKFLETSQRVGQQQIFKKGRQYKVNTQSNRYGVCKTSRVTNHINFVLKKLQMQTMIEPRTKFMRTSKMNIDLVNNRIRNQTKQSQQIVDLKDKKLEGWNLRRYSQRFLRKSNIYSQQ